jgi:hypothetical protein
MAHVEVFLQRQPRRPMEDSNDEGRPVWSGRGPVGAWARAALVVASDS